MRPDATVADAPADAPSAEVAVAPEVAAETGPAGCSAAELAACDDKNPCTTDVCAPGAACSHVPVAAVCDDSDPCTVEDACAGTACKGKPKNCDDNSPCTTDVCQMDGSCTNKPNLHYDCVPLIAVSSPPRGLRWSDAKGLLTVTGKVTAQTSPFKDLTVQGKPVVVQADGSFSTQVQLNLGSNVLALHATDVHGGYFDRVQGVQWAPQWSHSVVAGLLGLGKGLPAAFAPANVAAWVDALQPGLAAASYPLPTAFGGPTVAVKLGLAASPATATSGCCAGIVALAAVATPDAVAVQLAAVATLDAGTPVQPGCGALPNLGLTEEPKQLQWRLDHGLFNAALRAAWLAGAQSGDVSAATAGLAPGVTVEATALPALPWMLQGCAADGAMLQLADLRVHVKAPNGEDSVLAEGNLHAAIAAKPVWKVSGGKVELWLGATTSIAADFDMTGGVFFGSDIQIGLLDAAVKDALPKLLAQWGKAPLVSIPLPVAAKIGGVQLGWTLGPVVPLGGAVRVGGTVK